MTIEHQLSVTLRRTGHAYAADELDRLLTVIHAVNVEVADNQGRVEAATQYRLSALVHEQSAASADWGTVLSLNTQVSA